MSREAWQQRSKQQRWKLSGEPEESGGACGERTRPYRPCPRQPRRGKGSSGELHLPSGASSGCGLPASCLPPAPLEPTGPAGPVLAGVFFSPFFFFIYYFPPSPVQPVPFAGFPCRPNRWAPGLQEELAVPPSLLLLHLHLNLLEKKKITLALWEGKKDGKKKRREKKGEGRQVVHPANQAAPGDLGACRRKFPPAPCGWKSPWRRWDEAKPASTGNTGSPGHRGEVTGTDLMPRVHFGDRVCRAPRNSVLWGSIKVRY